MAGPADPGPGDDPLVGRLVDGRYLLHEKLGEGGMGAVYRATHVLMGKPCAVKVLRGPAAATQTARKRFQREAQSASRLDHEHCIRVTDFGRSADGVVFLVMELLEGQSLAEELFEKGALPAARAAAIAAQVAQALAHAHSLGVVHRDLKPDNVFLVERAGGDHVKVLDFGLAKILERGRGGRPLTTLTESGTVFGTPEYMSPEQAGGRPVDARADLYSLGIVLYQMLTGQLPFQGASVVNVLTKHLNETPISPAVRRPDLALPGPLVDLVMQCLEKDPARRPESAAAIADRIERMDLTTVAPRVAPQISSQATVELSAVGARAAVDAGPVAEAAAWEEPRRARRWPLWTAGLAMAAAIAGVALMATRSAGVREDAGVRAEATGDRQRATGDRQPASSGAGTGTGADAGTGAGADAGTGAGADAAPAPSAAPTPAISPAHRPTVADHLATAARYRRSGNRIKELFYLQEALRLEPGNRDALLRLGAALIEDGQHDLGCARLARAGNAAKKLWESAGCGSSSPH